MNVIAFVFNATKDWSYVVTLSSLSTDNFPKSGSYSSKFSQWKVKLV